MLDKVLKFLKIERNIKEIDFDKIFEDFYKSDIGGSQIIKDELGELVRKVLKKGIMQEFVGNSYNLEIYPDLVVIINSNNNNISKCSLDKFVEKMRCERKGGSILGVKQKKEK
ncbi:MAG: hypothetical protein Q9M94_03825 [Candidatus Gracilibacteria bacterium]|nr:hypothetical protein [Candidatus Gracilibacteria bacterium]MDQ7022888.1 hypothetical protein [Candidatus Gracilibacteria bacterium]